MTAKKHPLGNGRNVKEEVAHHKLMIELGEMDIFLRQTQAKLALIPEAWHTLEQDVPVRPRKTKITADFHAETVTWFRAMGLGYQARMNAVLRTFMLAVKSRYIERPTDYDWKGELLARR